MDRGKIKFDIVKTRNIWFIISLIVIGAGIASLALRGLNYGVDFTGGLILQFKSGQTVSTSRINDIMEDFNLEHSPPQVFSGDQEFQVRTASYASLEEIANMTKDERIAKAAEFNKTITDLKIAFNVELYDIDPDNFVLYHLTEKLERENLNEALSAAGFASETVTIAGTVEVQGKEETDPSTYNVTLRLSGVEGDQLKTLASALYKGLDGGYRQFEKEDTIDPVFGVELKKKAILSLLIATICILLYVTIRFEFWFALAAIIALVHDGLITVGFYSILQLQVNSAFVAIILTVFGYSINDTIVIFDRLRENMRKDKKSPLELITNVSLWETMPRSINTVLTTEVTILAILVLGGSSIKDIALGLSIGILSGCYSSILVAAPLWYIFKMAQGVGDRLSAVPPSASKPRKAAASPKKSAAPASKQVAADTSGSNQPDNQGEGKKKSGKKGKQRRR